MLEANDNFIFLGQVENGVLKLNEPAKFSDHLERLSGQEVEVVVRRIRHGRSMPQNKLYWVYLQVIAEATGHQQNELHEEFKRRFLNGESTANLSIPQFQEYLGHISATAAEMGIQLPGENEMDVSEEDNILEII